VPVWSESSRSFLLGTAIPDTVGSLARGMRAWMATLGTYVAVAPGLSVSNCTFDRSPCDFESRDTLPRAKFNGKKSDETRKGRQELIILLQVHVSAALVFSLWVIQSQSMESTALLGHSPVFLLNCAYLLYISITWNL
jgi:hypothetical protein